MDQHDGGPDTIITYYVMLHVMILVLTLNKTDSWCSTACFHSSLFFKMLESDSIKCITTSRCSYFAAANTARVRSGVPSLILSLWFRTLNEIKLRRIWKDHNHVEIRIFLTYNDRVFSLPLIFCLVHRLHTCTIYSLLQDNLDRFQVSLGSYNLDGISSIRVTFHQHRRTIELYERID